MSGHWQAGFELLAQGFSTTTGISVKHMRSHIQTGCVLVPALIITVTSNDHQVHLEHVVQVFATATGIRAQVTRSHVHSDSVLSPALIITSSPVDQSGSHSAKSTVHAFSSSSPPTAVRQARSDAPPQLPRTAFSDFTATYVLVASCLGLSIANFRAETTRTPPSSMGWSPGSQTASVPS